MTIKEALKKFDFEKHGMSDEFIIEFIGMDKIADDCVEDLQTYINELKWESDALAIEAEREFC